jgi:hypothetical protein
MASINILMLFSAYPRNTKSTYKYSKTISDKLLTGPHNTFSPLDFFGIINDFALSLVFLGEYFLSYF